MKIDYPKPMQNNYIPGVCNIGREEIRMRWMTGWIGLGITVAIWLGFIFNNSPAAWRLWLFVPAYVSAIGLLQASMHFCVAFGAKGLFNFKPQVGKTETVDQAEFRAKDKAKAIQIMLVAGLAAATVTALAFFTA